MHVVELPGQHTTKIVEVGVSVLVAALLGQPLHDPVAIGRATIQKQRHMVLHDGYLEVRLAGEGANACRTRELLHVGLLRNHLQHAADTTSVFHGNARLEQLHILDRIGIERGEQSKQVGGIVNGSSIEKYEVLVGGSSSHVVSAGGLANGGHTRQCENYLHDVRLAKRRRDVLQYLGLELLSAHHHIFHSRLTTSHNHNLSKLVVVGNACRRLLHTWHDIDIRR